MGCKETSPDFQEKDQISLRNNSSISSHESKVLDTNLTYKTFSMGIGWGYDIFAGNLRKLHQPHIPAINNLKCFETEEDAKKVALLVIHKIKTASFPPAVNKQELDSLNIEY